MPLRKQNRTLQSTFVNSTEDEINQYDNNVLRQLPQDDIVIREFFMCDFKINEFLQRHYISMPTPSLPSHLLTYPESFEASMTNGSTVGLLISTWFTAFFQPTPVTVQNG
jgi:hypothetical protein